MKEKIYKLFEHFNITDENTVFPSFASDELSRYKIKKEVLAEKLIFNRGVFSSFFDLKGRIFKITDKEQQKAGVDYIVNGNINIDIKADIGEYTDDFGRDIIPVELYQNNKISFDDTKKTTYVMWVNVNVNTDTFYVIAVPYKLVKEIVLVNIKTTEYSFLHKLYGGQHFISNNGSGEYIKLPTKYLEKIPGVLTLKTKLS